MVKHVCLMDFSDEAQETDMFCVSTWIRKICLVCEQCHIYVLVKSLVSLAEFFDHIEKDSDDIMLSLLS